MHTFKWTDIRTQNYLYWRFIQNILTITHHHLAISPSTRDVHCTREERRTWGILSQSPPPMSETTQIGGAYRRGAQEYSASPRPPCQRRHKMEGGTLRGRWLSNSSLHIDRSYFDIMSQCCAGWVRVGREGSVWRNQSDVYGDCLDRHTALWEMRPL